MGSQTSRHLRRATNARVDPWRKLPRPTASVENHATSPYKQAGRCNGYASAARVIRESHRCDASVLDARSAAQIIWNLTRLLRIARL